MFYYKCAIIYYGQDKFTIISNHSNTHWLGVAAAGGGTGVTSDSDL